jgi:hypothetical protein
MRCLPCRVAIWLPGTSHEVIAAAKALLMEQCGWYVVAVVVCCLPERPRQQELVQRVGQRRRVNDCCEDDFVIITGWHGGIGGHVEEALSDFAASAARSLGLAHVAVEVNEQLRLVRRGDNVHASHQVIDPCAVEFVAQS